MPRARFRLRFIGYAIDWLVIVGIGAIAEAAFPPLHDSYVAGISFVLTYFTAGYASGGTPGMRAMGLRVVSDSGGSPSLVRAFIRALVVLLLTFVIGGLLVTLIGLLALLGVLVVRRRNPLDFQVVGTTVVRPNVAIAAPEMSSQ